MLLTNITLEYIMRVILQGGGVQMKVDPIRNRDEIRKFKEGASSLRDRVMVEVGINCGLRIGDMRKIRVKDITDNSHINIQEEKTEKTRKVKLNHNVLEIVEEYIEKAGLGPEDYLLQSRQGDNRAISRVQAYRILNKMAERAGLDIKVGTHTLRKTFGFHHYRKYKDVAQLQAIFNHSSPDITLDYIGVTQAEIDRTAEEMYL